MPSPRVAAVLLAVVPSLPLAQASAGDTGLPYLWVWVVAAIVLLAAMVVLLFRASPRERARAHAAARHRRQLDGRA